METLESRSLKINTISKDRLGCKVLSQQAKQNGMTLKKYKEHIVNDEHSFDNFHYQYMRAIGL